MSIEQKLSELEKMPSDIHKKLAPYSKGQWGMYWNGKPEDTIYAETKDYKVVVAKWEGHEWGGGEGGIQWTEWLEVYFTKKETEEINFQASERIVTRDKFDERYDLKHLWSFNYAGIEILQGNTIKAYWKDKDGAQGPSYIYNLDDEVKRIYSQKGESK